MKWRGRRQSTNVEDRRGRRVSMGRATPIGCGTLLLLGVFAILFGADPQQLFEVLEQTQGQQAPMQRPDPRGAGGSPSDELGQFASVVLADTEETWHTLLPRMGRNYREPRLVLFSGQVRSACGFSSAAVGPFYCPADEQIYIDLSFFNELSRRFGAPGDFAQAYVIAHEVGHHVQNVLGISSKVQQMRQTMSRQQGNQLSIRLELQADCLAGVWANHAHRNRQLLEPGDVEEGLRAAAAIGDDMIQKRTTGYIQPESWTHGSAEQRQEWLRRGLQSGDPNVCQTF